MEDTLLTIDATLRLSAAVIAGALIGIDREVRGKPLGIRTLALVALGASMVCVSSLHLSVLVGHPDAMSRVVQGVVVGIMTGVGFLGAGVVLQQPREGEVQGLTTAATVWLAAAMGIACGIARWEVVALGVALAVFVLIGLRPLDRWLGRVRNQASRIDSDS